MRQKGYLRSFLIMFLLALAINDADGSEIQNKKKGTLSRELHGISLLMSPEEVKLKLKFLRFKIDEEDIGTTPQGTHFHYIILKPPSKEYNYLQYFFHKRRLYTIYFDYAADQINLDRFLSNTIKKNGENFEVEEKMEKIFGLKTSLYSWEDGMTTLKVLWGHPAEVPIFKGKTSGSLSLELSDEALTKEVLLEFDRAMKRAKEKRRLLEQKRKTK